MRRGLPIRLVAAVLIGGMGATVAGTAAMANPVRKAAAKAVATDATAARVKYTPKVKRVKVVKLKAPKLEVPTVADVIPLNKTAGNPSSDASKYMGRQIGHTLSDNWWSVDPHDYRKPEPFNYCDE